MVALPVTGALDNHRGAIVGKIASGDVSDRSVFDSRASPANNGCQRITK
jgi:hypothetical protein